MFGPKLTFERLYAEHGERVLRFCYQITGDAADAEDLAQDVLVIAFQSLDKFRGEASITRWLYRIAYFRWMRVKEERGPAAVTLDACHDASVENAVGSDSHIERVARDTALEAALQRLEEPLRVAVVLVKIEGLTYREAAMVLDTPQGTVQWRVHRAVDLLREFLAEPRARDSVVDTDQRTNDGKGG